MNKKLFLVSLCLGVNCGITQIFTDKPIQMLCGLVNEGLAISHVTIKTA